MNDFGSISLDYWVQIIKAVSHQIKDVMTDFSNDKLIIHFDYQDQPLEVNRHELNDSLPKFNGNAQLALYSLIQQRNKNIVHIYQNTLVAYFDIQAYSNFIDDTRFEDSIWRTSKLIKEIKSWTKTDMGDVKLNRWILSDSIIIVIDTERSPLFSGSIATLLGTCSYMMASAMRDRFPLRGAIGGGDFLKDGELLVSSALVDAARYEKIQNWFGAVLTPSAVELIAHADQEEIKRKRRNNIDSFLDNNQFICYGNIPWKNNSNIENRNHPHYYIKPHMNEKDWVRNYIPEYFEDRDGKIKKSDILYNTAYVTE